MPNLREKLNELSRLPGRCAELPWRVPNYKDEGDPQRHFSGVVNKTRVICQGNSNFQTYWDEEVFIAAACNALPHLVRFALTINAASATSAACGTLNDCINAALAQLRADLGAE